jgi:hypothetical protein
LSDTAPRLAPRSAVAAADFELLRVARHDLDEPERAASLTLADRLRGLGVFRAGRSADDADGGLVRLGRSEE